MSFRTLLGGPFDVSLSLFLRKWVNLIVLGSWGYAKSTSIREIFKRALNSHLAESLQWETSVTEKVVFNKKTDPF